MEKPLEKVRKAHEDDYFIKQNKVLATKLKAKMGLEQSGVHDAALLEELMSAGFTPDTLRLLFLVPLVEVAWADGRVQNEERDAILKIAEKRAVETTSETYKILSGWLNSDPRSNDLFLKSKGLVEAFLKEIQKDQPESAAWIFEAAKHIAEATGGIFGFGKHISHEEADALKALAKRLAP